VERVNSTRLRLLWADFESGRIPRAGLALFLVFGLQAVRDVIELFRDNSAKDAVLPFVVRVPLAMSGAHWFVLYGFVGFVLVARRRCGQAEILVSLCLCCVVAGLFAHLIALLSVF